jgi:hypothetical protein
MLSQRRHTALESQLCFEESIECTIVLTCIGSIDCTTIDFGRLPMQTEAYFDL